MRLMPFRRSTAALAAILALAAVPAAHAQSLKELYEAARAYDASYLAAKALAESAQYRVEQSEALARPSAALTATANTAQVDPPRFERGDSNSIGASLGGKVSLFNRFNSVTIEQARRSLLAAQADLDSAEQTLGVQVAQAYFDVLAAQDTLSTTRASKAAITEQLASAKRNFEVGTATITDTREAQARYDLAVAQELAAENDLLTKRIALDQLVGRKGVEPRPLAVPVNLPAPQPADADSWVTTADGTHPTIRKARVALDVATLEIDKQRASDTPTVDASASVGQARATGRYATTPGTTYNAGVGVTLTWPLYTGGLTQNKIKEAMLLEDKARSDLEAARRGVAQGTRVAYFGVNSGLSQVKALEAAESSSKLALEATQLGYKVGVRVNLDVLNAQTQLYTTQRDLAKARYDVIVNSLKLRQASGQLGVTDIDAANRLLAP